MVFTPTYASWLNRIECHFAPLRKFVLEGSDFRELKIWVQPFKLICDGEIKTNVMLLFYVSKTRSRLSDEALAEKSRKLWDVSPADKETYFPMMLVKVQGLVQMYPEKPSDED